MAYFLVDDQYHGHPKVRRASLEAVGLWTVAGSHCRAYKSEGFVPTWFVAGWPKGKQLATKLVAAGLWSRDHHEGEDGYRFHDWHHIHDPADEIERQREKGRERQRKRRAKAREDRGTDL
jgi:hypothetical protein